MIQFTKQSVILILRFFVWSVIAFCTFGLLSYAAIVPELTWEMVFADSKLYAPLMLMWPAHWHPSFDSTILLMAVPIALYLRYQDEKQISFVEMLPGVIFPIVFTILAGARVGMVVTPLLLGLGYLFYCKFKPVLKWGLLFTGIVAVGILLHLFPKTDDRFVDPIRSDLRKTAISAIKEKLVFGWGTGYVKPLIQSEERAHSLGIETTYDLGSFHNQYLENTVQFGIPGIIILVMLFGWMLWMGIREKNCLLLSLLVIYLIFCWTETALYVSKGVVVFVFWFCFIIANRTVLDAKRE
jgi:O-antigen ligase